MIIGSAGLAAVRVFGTRLLNSSLLTSELQAAGFEPCLGFELPDERISDQGAVPNGSLLIVEESSISSAERCLRRAAVDLSSLYFVVLARVDATTSFDDQAAGVRRGLSAEYRRVVVLPFDVDEPRLAREAAALVRTDRTTPESVLLWIVDDQPHRFGQGGCWAGLAEAAKAVPGLGKRLRVVFSLIGYEATKNVQRRGELVSVWREQILEPAAQRGMRCVIVTSSELCIGDVRLGEAWVSTVLQWLPSATAFIASRYQVDLRRRPKEGIWLGEEDRLVGPDRERIFEALGSYMAGSSAPRTSPQADPATALSSAPIRAVALSSDAFCAAWEDLLSSDEPEILRRLHVALTSHGPLDPVRRAALRDVLGWNEKLAERLAVAPSALSEWVAAVPASVRAQAAQAWLTELTGSVIFEESRAETEPADAVADGAAPFSEPTPSPARHVQPEGGVRIGGEPSPRFTFLSVMDEWGSRRGGLSTFNRELCLALARAGHRVQCLVVYANDAEIREAKQAKVDLLKLEQGLGDQPLISLYVPVDVPEKPDFILGHGRIMGPAALFQKRYHPGARRIHFFHMAPEIIEPVKAMARDPGRDFAAVAESRMNTELELARDAALVVAVGPRLYREIETQLGRDEPRPRVYQIDPGIVAGSMREERHPPPAIFCLVTGRVEDFSLKGVDLAASALGRLAGRARRRYKAEINLLVRGVEPGRDSATQELLRMHAGPQLGDIRIRPYVDDRAVLAGDLMQASLVLMPSREEGFGLVGLEAIAAGTPVLLTSRSGLADWLREVEPDLAGRMIVETYGNDPEDVTRWEDAIDAVLSDRKDAFERAARLRALLTSKYTWDRAARGLVGALAGLETQA